jgi:hypothetical protein
MHESGSVHTGIEAIREPVLVSQRLMILLYEASTKILLLGNDFKHLGIGATPVSALQWCSNDPGWGLVICLKPKCMLKQGFLEFGFQTLIMESSLTHAKFPLESRVIE